MDVIFVGIVVAAYLVQCGAAIAAVLAHAEAKAGRDTEPRFWPALLRWLKRSSPERSMR